MIARDNHMKCRAVESWQYPGKFDVEKWTVWGWRGVSSYKTEDEAHALMEALMNPRIIYPRSLSANQVK